MKNLSPVLARGLFYVISAALFAWSCSLTMKFLGDVLPNIELAKYLGLILFDLGAVSWLLVFLKGSQGLAQRAIGLTLSLLDLAGAVLIGFAEIMLGGQTFAEVPKDLGTLAIWSIAIWTAANLFAVLLFHLLDPTAQREMAQRNAMDKITAEALNQLDRQTDELAQGVAGELAEAWTQHLLLELDTMRRSALRLPTAIDAPIRDAQPAREPLITMTKNPTRKHKGVFNLFSRQQEQYRPTQEAGGLDMAKIDELLSLLKAQPENGGGLKAYQAESQAPQDFLPQQQESQGSGRK